MVIDNLNKWYNMLFKKNIRESRRNVILKLSGDPCDQNVLVNIFNRPVLQPHHHTIPHAQGYGFILLSSQGTIWSHMTLKPLGNNSNTPQAYLH